MVAFLGIPVAVLVGAICLAKKYPVESGTGIGGWLVVPGIGVCLMPVLLAWVTVVSLMEADWQEMPAAEIAGGSALAAILVGFLAACDVQTAVMFFRRRRLFPWAWMAVHGLVMLFVILIAVEHPDARLSALVMTSWTIGWSIYMFSSRRAKATFVR
jgi:uncharacterized protein DUF2569